MDRGDRREDIFQDEVDRQDFLKTLAETCQKTGFEAHAYCVHLNLALAARMRRETTLTMGWIARRLQLGTRKCAALKLHR